MRASLLAITALAAGVDQGFNFVSVEIVVDPNVLEETLPFTFGDYVKMKDRRPSPCHDWATSYDLDQPCMRDELTVDLPESARYLTTCDLKRQLVDKLLEAVPM